MNLDVFRNNCPYCNGLMFDGNQSALIEKALYMLYDDQTKNLADVESDEKIQKLVPSLLPSLRQEVNQIKEMLGIGKE